MICSIFITEELPQEEFITAVKKYDASIIAPVSYPISLDGCGCRPGIFDETVLSHLNDRYRNGIVLGALKNDSKDKGKNILAFTRHDMYVTPTTESEAKILFQQISGMTGNANIEQYKWDKNEDAEGILIKDVSGNIFDYPVNYRWEKSVFHTAAVPLTSLTIKGETLDDLMEPMLYAVNRLAFIVNRQAPNTGLKMMVGDYNIYSITPDSTTYCTIPQPDFLHGEIDFEKKENIQSAFSAIQSNANSMNSRNKFSDLLRFRSVERDMMLSNTNFLKEELRGYDAQIGQGIMTSFPEYFSIKKG
jgi:hypothetical protein